MWVRRSRSETASSALPLGWIACPCSFAAIECGPETSPDLIPHLFTPSHPGHPDAVSGLHGAELLCGHGQTERLGRRRLSQLLPAAGLIGGGRELCAPVSLRVGRGNECGDGCREDEVLHEP